jgi:hypothetical protein
VRIAHVIHDPTSTLPQKNYLITFYLDGAFLTMHLKNNDEINHLKIFALYNAKYRFGMFKEAPCTYYRSGALIGGYIYLFYIVQINTLNFFKFLAHV